MEKTTRGDFPKGHTRSLSQNIALQLCIEAMEPVFNTPVVSELTISSSQSSPSLEGSPTWEDDFAAASYYEQIFDYDEDEDEDDDSPIPDDLFEFDRFLSPSPVTESYIVEEGPHDEEISLSSPDVHFEFQRFLSSKQEGPFTSVELTTQKEGGMHIGGDIAILAETRTTYLLDTSTAMDRCETPLTSVDSNFRDISDNSTIASTPLLPSEIPIHATVAPRRRCRPRRKIPRTKIILSAIGRPASNINQIQEMDEEEQVSYPLGLVLVRKSQVLDISIRSSSPPLLQSMWEQFSSLPQNGECIASFMIDDIQEADKSYFSPDSSIAGDDDDVDLKKRESRRIMARLSTAFSSGSIRQKLRLDKNSPSSSRSSVVGECEDFNPVYDGSGSMDGAPAKIFTAFKRLQQKFVSFTRGFLAQ